MEYKKTIKLLYNLSENENYGYMENEIIAAENKLNIKFPKILYEYYLELGKNETINETFNKLLNPNTEVNFTDDDYLIFYAENQETVFWGINEQPQGKPCGIFNLQALF